jgi:hypothetical protein
VNGAGVGDLLMSLTIGATDATGRDTIDYGWSQKRYIYPEELRVCADDRRLPVLPNPPALGVVRLSPAAFYSLQAGVATARAAEQRRKTLA